jgi:cytochrome c5
MEHRRSHRSSRAWLALVVLGLTMPAAVQAADGRVQRSGKEVVDEVCIKCHGTGAQGAPRIGDKNAWRSRSTRGLTGLTQSALKGVRNMPPHGARFDLSDLELKRAIAYMVNQSGGNWREPVDTSRVGQRTGKEIVQGRCRDCHEEGKGGAPRIGDRAAWIPRLRYGFENVVKSAINGHGGMPARGGLPDLTDYEIRGAIVYMLNPDPPARR